ncbi:sigma-70 family RNA polymerase sigma factor [Elioraea rosea]|uniref:sigma-70 family RNA polymerase sigma factor n=1 Tax=Elioraea rosea TaxID=2492390 RepID=UPI001183D584|nr:sigma-70 family RNA polymerase sigma factor [Elioraea rosea]
MTWRYRHDAAIDAVIPALRRFAYGLTRNQHAADDLVQDCLLQALTATLPLRREASLKPWLFSILYRRFVSDHRRAVRRGGETSYQEEVHAPPSPPGHDAPLLRRDLVAALAQLPEEQRALLLLVGVEEMSYRDAADLLGIPIGTVMSRLARGRSTLRSLMEGRVVPMRRHG